jgi:F-type H+-transporting ATPase subunit epsilon
MPDAYPVQLVSPERILFDGEAEMVVCRPVDGSIAFLNGHVPYLGALADDEVRVILPGDGEEVAAVHGGFVQMTGDHLVVLSDLAELKGDIDVPRAERAKQAAEAALARDADDLEAQAALVRAETRLKVATSSS